MHGDKVIVTLIALAGTLSVMQNVSADVCFKRLDTSLSIIVAFMTFIYIFFPYNLVLSSLYTLFND